jgi:hypothetical protein
VELVEARIVEGQREAALLPLEGDAQPERSAEFKNPAQFALREAMSAVGERIHAGSLPSRAIPSNPHFCDITPQVHPLAGDAHHHLVAAVRKVPVHPVLIEAGLLRRAAEAKRRGSKLLFPELEGRRGGPDKRLGYYPTKEFTDYRRDIGVYALGLGFHALRHSLTTARDAAGVPRGVIDEITGHEGEGETSRYAKGLPLSILEEAVGKVDYEFNTGHLREH